MKANIAKERHEGTLSRDDSLLSGAGGVYLVGVQVRRKSKYNNVATTVDGIRFDSKREANRYGELKLLEKAKAIANIEIHPLFHILVGGELICKYEADFRYFNMSTGEHIVEDAKGCRTDVYKIKKKLMRAANGIEIREV